MQYPRAFVPAGSYFFTLVTERLRQLLTDDAMVDLLRQAFRHLMIQRPFEIDAAVILPDHLHCIWTLPPGDKDFSTHWRLIKTWFTRHYVLRDNFKANSSRVRKKQQAIWQHRFWEHVLRDSRDFEKHVDVIHYNPVKHDFVTRPLDWPYSSFHRYVEQGLLPFNWGTDGVDFEREVGRE